MAAIPLLCLQATTASAERGGVVVSGKASAGKQLVARNAAVELLRARGWSIADNSLAPHDTSTVTGCFASGDAVACVSRLAASRSLDRIAVLSLEDQHKDGAVTVMISERFIITGVPTVFVSQRFCDHCTDTTLDQLTRELTQELLDRSTLHGGRSVLSVKSTPQGARFSVDGSYVGATDASIDSVPGKHVVRIELDGYALAERQVETSQGETAEVAVTLHRLSENTGGQRPAVVTPPVVVPSTSKQSIGALPPVMVASGALAIIGGSIALALDGSDTVRPPNQDQPRGYYDTTIPGVVAIAGGAAAVGLGALLWWRRAHAVPLVAPTNGGGTIGLVGTF